MTWLRKYKREIPMYNFRHGNLMKDSEFLWSSRALFTADELIFRIQERECDPLQVVQEWCELFDETLNTFEPGHGITMLYAHMMESIGRDILRCMRAADKDLVCRTQIRKKVLWK